jgi:ribosome-binding factor A
MGLGSSRANRVPERIKEILAELVGQLKDPRIGFVTITDVRTTADFGHATAYYTVLPMDHTRSGPPTYVPRWNTRTNGRRCPG